MNGILLSWELYLDVNRRCAKKSYAKVAERENKITRQVGEQHMKIRRSEKAN